MNLYRLSQIKNKIRHQVDDKAPIQAQQVLWRCVRNSVRAQVESQLWLQVWYQVQESKNEPR